MKTLKYISIFSLLILFSCEENYVPKPRSFFRIDLPEREYQTFDDHSYPFKYDYPVYAEIKPYQQDGEKYWHNVYFKTFNAQINMSYLPVKNNLDDYISDALTFVNKHQQMANGIFERDYSYPEGKVYGTIFEISGNNVASTYQFYLTDSVHHFVRGALYIMSTPNNDSLQPIIDFLKEDVDNLVRTFEWRK
jgi:gliding motility-associated lipoprotein GldD